MIKSGFSDPAFFLDSSSTLKKTLLKDCFELGRRRLYKLTIDWAFLAPSNSHFEQALSTVLVMIKSGFSDPAFFLDSSSTLKKTLLKDCFELGRRRL